MSDRLVIDGLRVKDFIEGSGVRPEEVCVALDISVSTLRGMYRGILPVRRRNRILQALAQFMGIGDFAELLIPAEAKRTA